MERFSYPGEAFFNVKMIHLGIDTFLHVHSPQKQINKLKIYAVAGYVVILPDTAPEKGLPIAGPCDRGGTSTRIGEHR